MRGRAVASSRELTSFRGRWFESSPRFQKMTTEIILAIKDSIKEIILFVFILCVWFVMLFGWPFGDD